MLNEVRAGDLIGDRDSPLFSKVQHFMNIVFFTERPLFPRNVVKLGQQDSSSPIPFGKGGMK